MKLDRMASDESRAGPQSVRHTTPHLRIGRHLEASSHIRGRHELEHPRCALVDLLGKPIAECHALCVPTAQWGHPLCGPASVRGFVAAEHEWRHLTGLGWASLGLLELTALPTIGAERWVPWVGEADVLLVDGGDATYLCHWMRECGLADLLPSLPDKVWVGVSAGSMVMTPRIGTYLASIHR